MPITPSHLVIQGFQVITSPHLARYKLVRRSWKERLFSRPWQPLRRFNQVERDGGEVIIDKLNRRIYASPLVINTLKQRLAEQEKNHD